MENPSLEDISDSPFSWREPYSSLGHAFDFIFYYCLPAKETSFENAFLLSFSSAIKFVSPFSSKKAIWILLTSENTVWSRYNTKHTQAFSYIRSLSRNSVLLCKFEDRIYEATIFWLCAVYPSGSFFNYILSSYSLRLHSPAKLAFCFYDSEIVESSFRECTCGNNPSHSSP